MKTGTINLISGILLLGGVGLVAYTTMQEEDCSKANHTTLILIDKTDSLGSDALGTAKQLVWDAIEKAPTYSRLIFKEIVGESSTRSKPFVKEYCREIKPDGTTQLFAAEDVVKKKWQDFKNEICGMASGDDELACNHPSRGDGVLDRESQPSASSPILQRITDSTRQFLTSSEQSWTLIVITDWRQYDGKIDLHTRKCQKNRMPDYLDVSFLGSSNNAPDEKIFRVRGEQSRPSQVISLFAARTSMTNDEADCLQQFARGFIESQTGNVNFGTMIAPPKFEQLPQSPG